MQENKLRNQTIQIRVTAEEKKQIKQNAPHALSDWLRHLALKTKQPKERYVMQDPELIAQVKKIGNNLNQISRILNTHAKHGHTIDLINLHCKINLIEAQLIKLTQLGL